MTPEGIVVKEVASYFSKPKFQRFSIKRESPIQMGSDKRRADVVLVDSKGNLTAIAECKRPGVEGNGIDQLKSYLSATETRLGLFANSTVAEDWKFYKNLGQNRFREITRSKFERQLVNPIVSVLNFFLRSFRRLSKGRSGKETVTPSDKPLLDKPDPGESNGKSIAPLEPPIHYIGRYQPLQNESSLNSKPYYSEDNGFYWAANHQGIAECLPQHIKRIIHNEKSQIVSTPDELEQEIDLLREEVVELEAQKHGCEQELAQQTQELAEKKENLAGLEVHLKTLTVAVSEPPPIEGTPDDSNPELFNTPTVEDIPDNPIIKRREEEINDLMKEKADLEQAIDEKNQVLAGKKAELAGLEVELKGPTETELNPIAEAPSSHDASSVKHGFSRMSLITALISTIFCVFLAIYLFIFYASAVDKAFFLNTEAIQAQLAQGTYAGVNDIVNPSALSKAFQGEWNLFVVMFPVVFLAFAIALDYFREQGKWMYLILLAVFTLIFDAILAIQISQKIHEFKFIRGLVEEPWRFRMNDLNMWTVIFCGFVVSLLVSITYHVTIQRWQAVSPPDSSKAADIRESQIKNEKTQREARLAVLKTEMEILQSDINQLKEKEKATQQKMTKAVSTPIETQIVVLKAEMENLESAIEQLNKKDTAIQQKIDKTRAEIEKLLRDRNKRVVNRNKMESQINQFLNGWCRFVAHSGDGEVDVSIQINRIKQVAEETLNQYYQGALD